jgi:TetR/AcrR family transcriptional regulator, repressor for uid operon
MQTTNASKKSGNAQSTREKIIDAARKLVNSKGFHAMTTAELAVEAGINNALIYRHFRSKDDIILVVAEQFTDAQIRQRKEILEAATRGELSVFAAIKDLAYKRLVNLELGLFFEILAESCRNEVMAECMRGVTGAYRETIRQIATLARPDISPDELDVYVDLMTACFLGLGYRPAIGIADDAEKTSSQIAHVLMKTLSVAEPPQRKAKSSSASRSLRARAPIR